VVPKVKTANSLRKNLNCHGTEFKGDSRENREHEAKGKAIQALATKALLLIPCGVCGKLVNEACTQFVYDEDGGLCETCAKVFNSVSQYVLAGASATQQFCMF